MPSAVLSTTPAPDPALRTVSIELANIAVTTRPPVIDTVHTSPATVRHPAQRAKTEPGAAAAVSVTVVPRAYPSLQSTPQSMPPSALVTRPPPAPDVRTFSAKLTNVAVTILARLIATVHVAPDAMSHPLQPASVPPMPPAAVRSTRVPCGKVAAQLAPQSIPSRLLTTEPVPVPERRTDNARGMSSNVAVTVAARSIVTAQLVAAATEHPFQPVTIDPLAGTARSTIVV